MHSLNNSQNEDKNAKFHQEEDRLAVPDRVELCLQNRRVSIEALVYWYSGQLEKCA